MNYLAVDNQNLLKLIPIPLVVVRTPCLTHLLFRLDRAVGRLKHDEITRATAKTMGYHVFDLTHPDSERERVGMLDRMGEHYHPIYAEPPTPQSTAPDGAMFAVQSGDDEFIVFGILDGEMTGTPVTAAAVGELTLCDVRRPRNMPEYRERHERWCNEHGSYVMCFHRISDIRD